MVNVATAESPDTSGPNAENASEKKRRKKLQLTTNNNQPHPPIPKTSNPNTIPNWCARYVAKWDTPPETPITEIRRRQPTEASRILSSRQRRTSNSAGILGRPTTGPTARTNCPTPPTTKPTSLRKRRDTMM